jgi:Spy/CpxP family protein refolding chaperone
MAQDNLSASEVDMKRFLTMVVATAVLAGGALAVVSAQPGPGRRGGPFPLMRIPDLTDAQRQQIRQLMEERRDGADNPMRQVADLERQLHAELFADAPDTGKIEALKSQMASAHASALEARIDLQTKIAQILTPEQRKQLRENPGRAGRGGRGGFKRGGPPAGPR